MGYKAPKTEVRYVAPLEPLFEVLDHGEVGDQVHAGQDELGREVVDPVPMAPPVGYKHGPTLQDTILHMINHQALRIAADTQGFDTAEEADDFDIPDDPLDPLTEYEAEFMPVDELRKRLTAIDTAIKKKEAVEKEAANDGDTNTDERRVEHSTRGARRSDPERKGKSGKKQDADDERSVPEADSGSSGSDE